jgi:hypothetical protein
MTLSLTWLLVLTVCSANGKCVSQEIDQFNDHLTCTEARFEHETLPQDGDWKTVVYKCKLKNGMAT